MKTNTLLLSLLFAFAFAASANAKSLVNKNSSDVAVKGYDVVAFHTVGEATKGSKKITHRHGDAVYRFSSEENKALFAANPEKYEPAYGGYCAWGVAEKGKLFSVSIKTWQIVDGRLYLNYDKGVQKKFNEDVSGFISKADVEWESIVAKKKG